MTFDEATYIAKQVIDFDGLCAYCEKKGRILTTEAMLWYQKEEPEIALQECWDADALKFNHELFIDKVMGAYEAAGCPSIT